MREGNFPVDRLKWTLGILEWYLIKCCTVSWLTCLDFHEIPSWIQHIMLYRLVFFFGRSLPSYLRLGLVGDTGVGSRIISGINSSATSSSFSLSCIRKVVSRYIATTKVVIALLGIETMR